MGLGEWGEVRDGSWWFGAASRLLTCAVRGRGFGPVGEGAWLVVVRGIAPLTYVRGSGAGVRAGVVVNPGIGGLNNHNPRVISLLTPCALHAF
jgi:hypothetical protein